MRKVRRHSSCLDKPLESYARGIRGRVSAMAAQDRDGWYRGDGWHSERADRRTGSGQTPPAAGCAQRTDKANTMNER